MYNRIPEILRRLGWGIMGVDWVRRKSEAMTTVPFGGVADKRSRFDRLYGNFPG
jgi:hypothetical protein